MRAGRSGGMADQYVWAVIFFSGLVTYLARLLPLLLLTNASLPAGFALWLKYVPACVFGAMIFSEIFVRDGYLNLSWDNIYLISSIGVLAVAYKTKSLPLSIASGLLLFWLLQTQTFFVLSF
jgi:branched-subunit amino acid transport protein